MPKHSHPARGFKPPVAKSARAAAATPPDRFSRLAIAAALAVITLAVFWPVQHYDFINLDDPSYASDSPVVRAGLTWPSVHWAFTSKDPYAGNPLTTISYLVDSQLFGVNAAAFHRTNLLLHLVNTVLFFLLLQRLTNLLWPSACVAALFAWHPLHVEAVAWVSARKDLLSAFFWFGAVWFYAGYAQSLGSGHVEKWKTEKPLARPLSHPLTFYLVSLVLFTFGLLAKSTLVTLPFFLLLLDWWPLRRFQFSTLTAQRSAVVRLLLEKVPFAILGLVAGWWVFILQKEGGAIPNFNALSLGDRFANAAVSYVRYIAKLFWPANLAAFYPHPGDWPLWQVVGAALLLVVLTTLAVLCIRRRPYVTVGWFWFLGMLVPVIGLVQIGSHSIADRYTYLPLNGLFLLLVWGAHSLLSNSPAGRRTLGAAALVALLACGVSSSYQLANWRDSETLMKHTLHVTKDNYIAYNNLGFALQRRGELDEAIRCYREALRIKPDNAESFNNLGIVRERQGRPDEAVDNYRSALRIKPDYAEAHNNLGILLQRQGKLDEALRCYREALHSKPNLADAHYNLGLLHERQGKLAAAIESYREAAQCQPYHAEANNNLGALLQQEGRLDEAVACFAQALRARPDFAEAHFNLGIILEHQGWKDRAIACYTAAVRCKPGFAEAHFNLANSLARQGEMEKAIKHHQEAARLKPDWVDALNNLAWILATYPDARFRNGPQAVDLAIRAVELTRTNYPAALDTLAAAYAETGRFNDAAATAKQAIRLAESLREKPLVDEFAARLQLYENSRPFHTSSK